MASRRSQWARWLVLSALIGALAWWTLRARTGGADDAPLARSAPKHDDLPDQKDPPLTADNSTHAGLAPGFSPAAGEKEDKITVLDAPSRVMVRAPKEKPLQARRLVEDGEQANPSGVPAFTAPNAPDAPPANDLRDPSALVMGPSEPGVAPPPPRRTKRRASKKAAPAPKQDDAVITPLNVRDPSALVMPPSGGAP